MIIHCPRCQSISVAKKLLLIGPYRAIEDRTEYEGAQPEAIYADSIKEEYLAKDNPRFIEGFFCTQCDIGFIPDHYLKNPSSGEGNGFRFLGFWTNRQRPNNP